MKIAITGHTDGLGKNIHDFLITKYDVIGMSRSNGFDVSNTKQITDTIMDCDIFINNTHYKNAQTDLFTSIFDLWKGLDKTIINLNSSCVYHSSDWSPEYAESKKELRRKMLDVINLNPNKKLKVINLYPATLDTHIGFNEYNKIDVNYITKTIDWVITLPKEIELREISIYPTAQKKEYKINTLI